MTFETTLTKMLMILADIMAREQITDNIFFRFFVSIKDDVWQNGKKLKKKVN